MTDSTPTPKSPPPDARLYVTPTDYESVTKAKLLDECRSELFRWGKLKLLVTSGMAILALLLSIFPAKDYLHKVATDVTKSSIAEAENNLRALVEAFKTVSQGQASALADRIQDSITMVTNLHNSHESVRAQAAALRKQIENLESDAYASQEKLRKLGDLQHIIDAIDSVRAAALSEAKQAVGNLVPVGAVVAWPSNARVPKGWAVCDGSEVPFNETLWDILSAYPGNKLTNGQKPSKITLPDFQGRFLRGWGGDSEDIGTPQADAVIPHTHDAGSLHALVALGGRVIYMKGAQIGYEWTDGMKTNEVGQNGNNSPINVGAEVRGRTGPVNAHTGETRPKNYAVKWVMRIDLD